MSDIFKWRCGGAAAALAMSMMALSTATYAGFTELERQALRAAAQPDASGAVKAMAQQIASQHGKSGDVEALEYFIAEGKSDLAVSMIRGGGYASVLDSLVIKHFENRAVATAMIHALTQSPHSNPAVFELLYRDVETLARWKAERRAKCRFVVATPADIRKFPGVRTLWAPGDPKEPSREPASGTSWRLQCASDSEAGSQEFKLLREDASVWAIGRTTLPGVEGRLVPLVRDLSMGIPVEPAANGRWPRNYDETYLPTNLLGFLLARKCTVEFSLLKEILDSRERSLGARDDNTRQWHDTITVLNLVGEHNAPEATMLLAHWIERAAEIPDLGDRTYMLTRLIPLLGRASPGAQVDLAALRAKVLAGLPDQYHVRTVEELFKNVARQNLELREPSADSLIRAMRLPDHEKRVRYLLAQGVPVNSANGYATPLIEAVGYAPDMIPLLIQHGVDVNQAAGPDRATPLIVASRYAGNPSRSAVVALLLAHGADVNKADHAGVTPLHVAAQDNPAGVKALLKAGAKVDARDWLGQTPLSRTDSIEAATALLDAGADPNAAAQDGESPFSNSLRFKTPDFQNLLAARGGRLTTAQFATRAKEAALKPIIKPLIENFQRH